MAKPTPKQKEERRKNRDERSKAKAQRKIVRAKEDVNQAAFRVVRESTES
jgi:hypothetical protein